jgi:hypothetical protein
MTILTRCVTIKQWEYSLFLIVNIDNTHQVTYYQIIFNSKSWQYSPGVLGSRLRPLQVNYFWFMYEISMSLVIYYWITYVNSTGSRLRPIQVHPLVDSVEEFYRFWNVYFCICYKVPWYSNPRPITPVSCWSGGCEVGWDSWFLFLFSRCTACTLFVYSLQHIWTRWSFQILNSNLFVCRFDLICEKKYPAAWRAIHSSSSSWRTDAQEQGELFLRRS